MAWGAGTLADLSRTVAKHYEEIVTTRVHFEELRRQSKETAEEFKSLVRDFEARVRSIEVRHAEEKASLGAKIDALSSRLDSLSEQALHTAVCGVVREYLDSSGKVQTDQLLRSLGTSSRRLELPDEEVT